MFRRQPFDKVNPRNVLPSRHTIFIRGLPGPTDVTKVKEFFSAESNSKCSVDFFSTSDDKKRLSVAIRFKSHDVARDMLMKYNNKPLLGFPVEVTWFKDLKKARAKMFEEQRQGARQFQRNGPRGNFRNNGRGIPTSPTNYGDNRHARGGSSSSGGATGGNLNRPKYSQSRSRSFTGSSSRSPSQSGRSGSASPHIRRNLHNPSNDARGSMRGFSDGQPPPINDRRIPRNQSYRSASGSSSSSRSSPGLRLHQGSTGAAMANQKTQSMRYQHGRAGASPLNYAPSRRDAQMAGSPGVTADYSSFANAPAPDIDGGSSLVSGLIQLKRRNQPESQETRLSRRNRRSSIGSSSSGMSGASPRASNSGRQRVPAKRLPSLSPTFTSSSQRDYKVPKTIDEPPMVNDENPDFSKRKRSRQTARSPGSYSPPAVKSSLIVDPPKSMADNQDSSVRQRAPSDQQDVPRHGRRDVTSRSNRMENRPSPPVDSSQWRSSVDGRAGDGDGWTRSFNRTVERSRKSGKPMDDSFEGQSSNSELESDVPEKRIKPAKPKGKETDLVDVSKDNSKEVSNDGNQDVLLDLIRQRKESLAQDYKRDCEAFTTVVRTLISRDVELENRLMPMLKEILHERGQRCIEELRSFISYHQPESETKTESAEVPPV